MKINTKKDGQKMTFELEGWLDTQAAPQLEEELDKLGEDVTELNFDCSALEYISSSGLRQLVAAHKKMKGAFTISNVSAEIMDVLNMTGMSKRLNIV